MATSFGSIVTTITQDHIIPKVTDNILNGNILFGRLMSKKRQASGHQLLLPIKYQSSTSGDSYSGFDTFSTSQVNTRVMAEFDPKQTYWSVVLSGIQTAVNQGQEKVLDLLATEMDSVAADMADDLGTQLYSDGTGNSSKDITGLDAAVDDGKIAVAVNKFVYMLETLVRFLVGGLTPLKI